jgi:hypothetical protein
MIDEKCRFTILEKEWKIENKCSWGRFLMFDYETGKETICGHVCLDRGKMDSLKEYMGGSMMKGNCVDVKAKWSGKVEEWSYKHEMYGKDLLVKVTAFKSRWMTNVEIERKVREFHWDRKNCGGIGQDESGENGKEEKREFEMKRKINERDYKTKCLEFGDGCMESECEHYYSITERVHDKSKFKCDEICVASGIVSNIKCRLARFSKGRCIKDNLPNGLMYRFEKKKMSTKIFTSRKLKMCEVNITEFEIINEVYKNRMIHEDGKESVKLEIDTREKGAPEMKCLEYKFLMKKERSLMCVQVCPEIEFTEGEKEFGKLVKGCVGSEMFKVVESAYVRGSYGRGNCRGVENLCGDECIEWIESKSRKGCEISVFEMKIEGMATLMSPGMWRVFVGNVLAGVVKRWSTAIIVMIWWLFMVAAEKEHFVTFVLAGFVGPVLVASSLNVILEESLKESPS